MSNVVTGFFWHSTENYTWSFWVMFCAGQNYLNLKEPKKYWPSRFFFIWSELSKNCSLRRLFFFATPSPHYHDLGQIFPMLAQGWVLYAPRYANISNVGPRLVFGRTSLRPVRSATTTGQYSPLRSVSKKLVFNLKEIMWKFPVKIKNVKRWRKWNELRKTNLKIERLNF